MATKTRVTADQLARDLARRLDVDEQRAQELLDGLCAALRDHLQAGQVVEVADLFRLAVSGRAELREDESGGFSAYAPSERALEVEPLGALRTDLEKASSLSVYYISRGKGDFVELLQDYFGRRGWQLVHKQNAMEVQSQLTRHPPVAIIFEQHVEGWKELLRELKCDPRTNWVPVVGIFPEMTNPNPVNEIEIRPDEVIREPFDFSEFVRAVGSELAARVMHPDQDVTEIEVHLPGTERCRGDVRQLVEEILFRSALPEDWTADAGGALAEALDNAWRHGHQLIDCCTISVHVVLDPRRLVLAVRDSGTGFDHHAALINARSRRYQESDALAKAQQVLASKTRRGHEREGGVTRMLRLVDRVEFNRTGNQVVLTKKRPRPE
jgi:anti-sigma regulatory factor (Ser/Thr protein kinase)